MEQVKFIRLFSYISLTILFGMFLWHSKKYFYNKKPDKPLEWTVTNTINYYQQYYQRNPPRAYAQWINYAQQRQCVIDPTHYIQLHKDIDQFRDPIYPNNPTINRKIIHTMSQMEFTVKIGYNPLTQFTNNLMNIKENVRQILPTPFDMVHNLKDEPRSLTADDYTQKFYEGPQDTLNRNKCLRNHYDSDGKSSASKNHGTFLNPMNFVTVPFKIPIFSLSALECYNDIHFPNQQEEENLIQQLQDIKINGTTEWENKYARLVWRGTSIGSNPRMDTFKLMIKTHRFKLVKWGMHQNIRKTLPIEIDIGFEDTMWKVAEYTRQQEDMARKEYVVKEYLSNEQLHESKYLVVVDGNSRDQRMIAHLFSKSLIFTNTQFNTFYLPWFQDGVHYIRIKPDLSDFEEKLLWAINHDDEAKQIAQNAYDQASKFLRLEDLQCYKLFLLQEYSSLVD